MVTTSWRYNDIPDQSGRVALVTGANAGIGLQEARLLAKKGAEVILAGRNPAKLEQAVSDIATQVPNAKLSFEIIDLADLDSIAKGADRIKAKYSRLDLLLNSAGVMIPPLSYTKQGFELQFGTNYLGHFALTGQLLPLILKTKNSRIVSMTSLASGMGAINFKDPNYRNRRYLKMQAYAQSKLANILFINELAHKLAAVHAQTKALIAHPGGANTGLMSNGGFVLRRIVTPLGSQSTADAALPILRAACDPEARNGSFWGPSGLFGLTGDPKQIKISAKGSNRNTGQQLWDLGERLTGVSFEQALGNKY